VGELTYGVDDAIWTTGLQITVTLNPETLESPQEERERKAAWISARISLLAPLAFTL
jgi:hypothetical protein